MYKRMAENYKAEVKGSVHLNIKQCTVNKIVSRNLRYSLWPVCASRVCKKFLNSVSVKERSSGLVALEI